MVINIITPIIMASLATILISCLGGLTINYHGGQTHTVTLILLPILVMLIFIGTNACVCCFRLPIYGRTRKEILFGNSTSACLLSKGVIK